MGDKDWEDIEQRGHSCIYILLLWQYHPGTHTGGEHPTQQYQPLASKMKGRKKYKLVIKWKRSLFSIQLYGEDRDKSPIALGLY